MLWVFFNFESLLSFRLSGTSTASGTLWSGRHIVKVVPWPRPSDATIKDPPCCSAIPLAMNKPNRLPWPACSSFTLNYTPSPKTFATCSAVMPAPVSVTSTCRTPLRKKVTLSPLFKVNISMSFVPLPTWQVQCGGNGSSCSNCQASERKNKVEFDEQPILCQSPGRI
jgi:hypothetical protein